MIQACEQAKQSAVHENALAITVSMNCDTAGDMPMSA
jgi:hypothetical protein